MSHDGPIEGADTAMDVSYRPGSAALVAAAGGIAVLPETVPASVLATVWRRLEASEGLNAVLDSLAGSFGTSLSSIPPFVLLLAEGEGFRAVVRGDMRVRTDAPGFEQDLTGAGTTTWTERRIDGAGRIEVRTGSARLKTTATLPVASGVVLAATAYVSLAGRGDPADGTGAEAGAAAQRAADREAAEAEDAEDAEDEFAAEDFDIVTVEDDRDLDEAEDELVQVAPDELGEFDADEEPDEPGGPDPDTQDPDEEEDPAALGALVASLAAGGSPGGDVRAAVLSPGQAPAEAPQSSPPAAAPPAGPGFAASDQPDPGTAGSDAPRPARPAEDAAASPGTEAPAGTAAPAEDAALPDEPNADGDRFGDTVVVPRRGAGEEPAGAGPGVPETAPVPMEQTAPEETLAPAEATIVPEEDDAPPAPGTSRDAAAQDETAAPTAETNVVPQVPASPAAAPGAAAGDHDGETISVAQAHALRDGLGDHDGETVSVAQAMAARSPADAGYAAPEDAASAQAQSPGHGRIRLSSGLVVDLDRSVIVGRRPRSPRVTGGTMPRLVEVDSPQQDISRNHLEIRPEDDSVVVVDLRSTNGTTLLRAGAEPVRLHPGEETLVVSGDVVDIGDGVTIAFEALS